jgi:hypothetical protein
MDVYIEYKPHPNQLSLHEDPHRYRVVVAGRRFGKSVFARQEIIRKALFYKPVKEKVGIYQAPRFWIVSPTYRQGKEIHWMELKKEIPSQLIESKNEQDLSVHLVNGSVIELKGADNEDNLRGAGLMGVVMDEAAYQKSHVWKEIIQPMLLETGGWAVFIGTPKGFNFFYDLYQRGQPNTKKYDPEWASWRFTSYENPYVDKAEIDKKKDDVGDDTFSQEYLGDFTSYESKIYKEFTQDIHVIKPISIPSHWKRYGGFDFSGGKEPAALVIVAIDPENDVWYVMFEYLMKEKPSRIMISEMKSFIEGGQIAPVEMIWCDPHAEQLRQDYADNEFYMSPARKETATQSRSWVRHGIDLLKGKMKINPIDKHSGLYIFNTCEELIREIDSYEWKEPPNDTTSEVGVPIKKNDHLLDALRYMAVSYKRQEDRQNTPREHDWSIGIERRGGEKSWSL